MSLPTFFSLSLPMAAGSQGGPRGHPAGEHRAGITAQARRSPLARSPRSRCT
jgi:hypothetical protein